MLDVKHYDAENTPNINSKVYTVGIGSRTHELNEEEAIIHHEVNEIKKIIRVEEDY